MADSNPEDQHQFVVTFERYKQEYYAQKKSADPSSPEVVAAHKQNQQAVPGGGDLEARHQESASKLRAQGAILGALPPEEIARRASANDKAVGSALHDMAAAVATYRQKLHPEHFSKALLENENRITGEEITYLSDRFGIREYKLREILNNESIWSQVWGWIKKITG